MDHGRAAAALAGFVQGAAASSVVPAADLERCGIEPGEAGKRIPVDPGEQGAGARTDPAGRGAPGSGGPAWVEEGGGGSAAVSGVWPWATAERTLALWCADWPLVAAGVPPGDPAVVLHAGRTVACTPAARVQGVHRGMRRRDAEARCPSVAVLAHDPGRDARAFESVVAAVEAFAPRVELTRPGLCVVATRGPSRYFGGDDPLAARLVAAVREVLGTGAAHIGAGVAEGAFAASLAARATAGGAPILVLPSGGTPAFLADLPVSALVADLGAPGADAPAGAGGRGGAAGAGRRRSAGQGGSAGSGGGTEVAGVGGMADLASLLVRLGLRTLGAVAALPEADVVARFGAL
ncbi:MAG: hypothetical protein ABIS47_13440, partial [Acidimicrobiales bacterium]